MAELDTGCCSPATQATCCEPEDKAGCCGPGHGEGCGCAEGSRETATADIREAVREKYAAAAVTAAGGSEPTCCSPADHTGAFGSSLYSTSGEAAPEGALSASLGCGVPTAVADLHEGETVLDLGSGAGADVLISARRVGLGGKVIGIDMTDEMLELARANAAEAGITNVEFRKGYLEQLPLPDESVDVVISNCVINLSGDKPRVLAEAARVLRPGGRFAVSDVIADPDRDQATRLDIAAWTGCIAGALTEAEFRGALGAAGLSDVEIRETHRVHERAAAAIIRAEGQAVGPASRGLILRCGQAYVSSERAAAATGSWRSGAILTAGAVVPGVARTSAIPSSRLPRNSSRLSPVANTPGNSSTVAQKASSSKRTFTCSCCGSGIGLIVVVGSTHAVL